MCEIKTEFLSSSTREDQAFMTKSKLMADIQGVPGDGELMRGGISEAGLLGNGTPAAGRWYLLLCTLHFQENGH